MVLKALLDTLDGLSDSDQAHYKKITTGVNTGKFQADITPVSGKGSDGKDWSLSLDDVGGLRKSLEDRRAKHETAQSLLDTFKDSEGKMLDPKAFADATTKLAAMEGMVDKDKVEEIVKGRMVEHQKKFDTDLSTMTGDRDKRVKQLHNVVIRGSALVAISKLAPKGVKMLLPHVMERLGINDKGEMPTAFVIGENGNPRISLKPGSGSEDLMQPDELVEEMGRETEFAPAFPGSGKTGTGAPPETGGALGEGGAVTLTREQASDVPTYQKARAEADKLGVPLVTTD